MRNPCGEESNEFLPRFVRGQLDPEKVPRLRSDPNGNVGTYIRCLRRYGMLSNKGRGHGQHAAFEVDLAKNAPGTPGGEAG